MADIRRNNQLKHGDIREPELVFLDLTDCVAWAEVPLLAHNFSKRTPLIRRPPQDEFLRTGCLLFLEDQRYVF